MSEFEEFQQALAAGDLERVAELVRDESARRVEDRVGKVRALRITSSASGRLDPSLIAGVGRPIDDPFDDEVAAHQLAIRTTTLPPIPVADSGTLDPDDFGGPQTAVEDDAPFSTPPPAVD